MVGIQKIVYRTGIVDQINFYAGSIELFVRTSVDFPLLVFRWNLTAFKLSEDSVQVSQTNTH